MEELDYDTVGMELVKAFIQNDNVKPFYNFHTGEIKFMIPTDKSDTSFSIKELHMKFAQELSRIYPARDPFATK